MSIEMRVSFPEERAVLDHLNRHCQQGLTTHERRLLANYLGGRAISYVELTEAIERVGDADFFSPESYVRVDQLALSLLAAAKHVYIPPQPVEDMFWDYLDGSSDLSARVSDYSLESFSYSRSDSSRTLSDGYESGSSVTSDSLKESVRSGENSLQRSAYSESDVEDSGSYARSSSSWGGTDSSYELDADNELEMYFLTDSLDGSKNCWLSKRPRGF